MSSIIILNSASKPNKNLLILTHENQYTEAVMRSVSFSEEKSHTVCMLQNNIYTFCNSLWFIVVR